MKAYTKEEMAKADDFAVNHFGIEVEQLMEIAGFRIAYFAHKRLGGLKGKNIVVLCGKGNNGGDGLTAARFMHSWGAKTTVAVASHPDELNPHAKHRIGTLKSMYVNVMYSIEKVALEKLVRDSDLLVDALLGYNAEGNPSGYYAELISLANNSGKKILSVDVPSGLHPDTGEPSQPCIRAKWTVCLGLAKQGCVTRQGQQHAGDVWVADIGMPPEVYEKIGIEGQAFQEKGIVKWKG